MIPIINANENKDFLKKLLDRNQFEFEEINKTVEDILKEVKINKDRALKEYTYKFDGVNIDEFLVSEQEIEEAFRNINTDLKNALEKAKSNIVKYHKKQIIDSYFINKDEDIMLGQNVCAIEKVGIYVPGGLASYPSTVLMNGVPAKIAGVKEIIMVTPPNKEGKIKDSILVAASICGIDKIYKVGGAQSIAALTYGTETIPKVSKIVGPGNIYVAMAKKLVSGYVGIDMIAGPSEILIIADETANPKYVAADLMSQAEHDELAASILITNSEKLAKEVIDSLKIQIKTLKRNDIIEKSLKNFGAILITNSINESINIANEIAPEHLELLTRDPFDIYKQIKNAGAIFLGEFSPEPLGDYYAGPNHTLPTSGTAKFSSPLSVTDFLKKTSLIYYSKKELKKAKDSIIRIAEDEGLTAHANAIRVRFEGEDSSEM